MSKINAMEKYTFNTEGKSVTRIADMIIEFMATRDSDWKSTEWSFIHEGRTLTINKKV